MMVNVKPMNELIDELLNVSPCKIYWVGGESKRGTQVRMYKNFKKNRFVVESSDWYETFNDGSSALAKFMVMNDSVLLNYATTDKDVNIMYS